MLDVQYSIAQWSGFSCSLCLRTWLSPFQGGLEQLFMATTDCFTLVVRCKDGSTYHNCLKGRSGGGVVLV